MIGIDKDVPVPDGGKRIGRPSKYPFEEMEVGDSFLADKPDSVRVLVRRFSLNSGRTFMTRKEGSGARVWRVS